MEEKEDKKIDLSELRPGEHESIAPPAGRWKRWCKNCGCEIEENAEQLHYRVHNDYTGAG